MSGTRCPIGSLGLHTWNYERTECIWCGPGALAWKPGHWVPLGNGMDAWSTTPAQPGGDETVPTMEEADG